MQEVESSQIYKYVQLREDKGRVPRAEIRIWLGQCGFTVLRKKEAVVKLRSRAGGQAFVCEAFSKSRSLPSCVLI